MEWVVNRRSHSGPGFQSRRTKPAPVVTWSPCRQARENNVSRHQRATDPSNHGPEQGFVNPWVIIRRRKVWAALGVVVGLALASLYTAYWPRKYESTAQLLIKRRGEAAPISGTNPGQPPL